VAADAQITTSMGLEVRGVRSVNSGPSKAAKSLRLVLRKIVICAF